MKKHQALSFLFSCFFIHTAFAWTHSVEFGYGYSHDPRHTRYDNSGFLLSGDVYPLWRTPCTYWSITGSLGRWHTTEPEHENLITGAVSASLRYYLFDFENTYPTYLFGSVGPAILSNRHFGKNTQGSNFTFQTNLGLGAEFCPIDVNLRLVHFSNASLAHPNHGFNILYLLSIGYLF